MSKRAFLFALVLAPMVSLAQDPAPAPPPFNAPTLAVLMANKPERFTEAQWLEMMQQPVHRSLYPLRITQAMLDTLDGSALDRRFNYQMVRAMPR